MKRERTLIITIVVAVLFLTSSSTNIIFYLYSWISKDTTEWKRNMKEWRKSFFFESESWRQERKVIFWLLWNKFYAFLWNLNSKPLHCRSAEKEKKIKILLNEKNFIFKTYIKMNENKLVCGKFAICTIAELGRK
jgi:hypothetical protein